MAQFSIPNIQIAGIASAVPYATVDNLGLDIMQETERNTFVKKVGIKTRRIAPPGVCASDLCIAAAEKLLNDANEKSHEIEVLVFVTQTPDFLLPGNSMLAQKRLGLPKSALLLDVNQGCAGYVYGLSTLSAMMHATGAKKGLLLVGDTISKLISPADKSTLPIFSDAGSATLLLHANNGSNLSFNVGAAGEGAEVICVHGGGAREPFTTESLEIKDRGDGIRRAPLHLTMQGVDVLQYSFRYVVPNIMELLAASPWTIDNLDHYIFHQANRLLNESITKKLGLDPLKVPESLSDFGNTSSATIPVTINYRLKNLSAGTHKLLLSGFGVGFSWGSALAEVNAIVCPDVIEYN